MRYAGTPQSQSSVSDGVSRIRGPMTPERCPSTVAMVMSCFPAWREFGPVVGDGGVEVEFAAVGE